MIPPTSIDGTDITGATIDGTDVTEITVDGQTVFTAQTLPVAFSNLVAWYPFDSGTYGGSNADDVTAIIGGSGDDTAYNGTVNGATYQSASGVTDIEAGANSGAFDFDGTDDINLGTTNSVLDVGDFTITVWGKADSFSDTDNIFTYGNNRIEVGMRPGEGVSVSIFDGNFSQVNTGSRQTGVYTHLVMTYDRSANQIEGYFDGVFEGTATSAANYASNQTFSVGGVRNWDGNIDDLRFYNRVLSGNEIDQIYQNTKP